MSDQRSFDGATLTIVIPVYNEEAVVNELWSRLRQVMSTMPVRTSVIFVDDGSSDASAKLLTAICDANPECGMISFSRNFGHQVAITAGLDYAHGDAVVVMDADLQDPPEVVVQMLEKWRQGFDVVYGTRSSREGETIFKRATAAIFYRVLRRLVGVAIPLDAGDFRLMSKRVVLTLRALRETSRFVRGLVAWLGFRQCAVEYQRPGRFAGETHYPLRKMIRFAVDGITAFSTVPLRLATWLGGFAGFTALCVALWTIIVRIFYPEKAVLGWATTMLAVTMGTSAQLVMAGILGEYVGRIYEEVKRRPLYIVGAEVNASQSLKLPERSRIHSVRPPPLVATENSKTDSP